jgi:hypothetical protein
VCFRLSRVLYISVSSDFFVFQDYISLPQNFILILIVTTLRQIYHGCINKYATELFRVCDLIIFVAGYKNSWDVWENAGLILL